MLRFIIRESDDRPIALGALSTSIVTHKTFDIDAPEIEKYLAAAPEYVWRQFVGIEILTDKEKNG